MPQVIVIEPDNFSPLVINVNSFHLADVPHYLNLITVRQLLTIESGM